MGGRYCNYLSNSQTYFNDSTNFFNVFFTAQKWECTMFLPHE